MSFRGTDFVIETVSYFSFAIDCYTVSAAAIVLYYIFLFHQSAVALMEFNRARQAYREKKIEEKPSFRNTKYGSENVNILAANRW